MDIKRTDEKLIKDIEEWNKQEVVGLDYKKMYEDMPKEIYYTIIPSKLDINELYDYMINNMTFEQVLSLYIKLRIKISTGKNKGD